MEQIAQKLLDQVQVVPLRSGEKRGKIIEAALDLMAHYGYRKTTVDEIAEKAGVAKGTVYLYFRDKREILMSIVRSKMAEVIGKMLEEIKREPDVPSKMMRMVALLISYHRRDAMLNQILTENPEIWGPIFAGTLIPLEEIVRQFLSQLLRMGIEEGSIDPEVDPDTTAVLLFRLNQATIFRIKTGAALDEEKYLDALRRMIFHGIGKGADNES